MAAGVCPNLLRELERSATPLSRRRERGDNKGRDAKGKGERKEGREGRENKGQLDIENSPLS